MLRYLLLAKNADAGSRSALFFFCRWPGLKSAHSGAEFSHKVSAVNTLTVFCGLCGDCARSVVWGVAPLRKWDEQLTNKPTSQTPEKF